jgi:diguanylate cyclase (GGDEF)-like protein
MGGEVATQAPRIAVSGFELVEELGRGATTAVYRALREGEEYAVKIQELSGPDDPARLTFRREAAILAAIRHPCLGKVYEVGDDGRISYLAMDLIAGRTLALAVEEEGTLPESRVLSVAADVASALDAAHRVGLVHRDVGPRNIVLRSDGRAVLIDFGLATQTGTRQPEDVVIGTVIYSAPEQTGMVRRPVDRRSDLYSLGAVLFECVTGRPPFQAVDVGEVVRMHAVTPPVDVRSIEPGVSVQLSRIIARLLAKDPDDRYQEASSLLSDIEALRRGTLAEDAVLGQAIADQSARMITLVGRELELAGIAEIVKEARSTGAGSTVLIESDPGGGKTRLVDELAHIARGEGMTVLVAHLGIDHPGPLGPLAQAFGRYFADLETRHPATLARLRSEIGLDRPGAADSLAGLSRELDSFLSTDEEQAAENRAGTGFHEFAVIEMAHLLMAVAAASTDGTLLVLDNAHLADDATHRVLSYLAPELERLRLVVVLTARNGPSEAHALARLRTDMGEAVGRRIELSPLSDDQIEAILKWQLGGDALDSSLANEITIRANGNPAAAVEYLRSALEAGVLRPCFGTFSVDAEALASLDLPTDVRGLALRRLDNLHPATRWLLTEAAVIGSSFYADLLAKITKWPVGDVHVALGEAASARVVESQGSERFVFLHEGVRDTLLASFDSKASKRAHEMLARTLHDTGDNRPEMIYDVARHYALGDIATDPKRSFQANHRAARLALAAQADDDALAFLATAESVAEEFHISVGSAFETDFGTALARSGQIASALEHYQNALGLERERIGKARIHEHIARVFYAQSNGSMSLEHAQEGLSELGAPLPTNGVLVAVSTIWRCLRSLLMGLTRFGFGKARRGKREKVRLECRLLEVAGDAADLEHRSFLAVGVALRALLPANRLGHAREYVGAYAHLGVVLAQVRLVTAARLVARHTSRVAERTGDHATIVHAKLLEAISLEFQGESVRSQQLLANVLRTEARWLQPGEYLSGVLAACIGLGLRGRIFEQVAWIDEATRHASTATRIAEGTVNGLDFVGIAISGLLEQPTVGLERISRVRDSLAGTKTSRISLAGYEVALANFHFGLNELGAPFEQAIDQFRALKLPPWNCPYNLSSFWIVQAYGRIAQMLNSSETDRTERTRLARKAVRQLRIAARTPLLRAHYFAARTGYHVAKGRYKRALRASAKGQTMLIGLDGPGVEMAIQTARSRALAGAGHLQESERMAVAAARLAEDLGITAFVRWIQPALPDRTRTRVGLTYGSPQSHTMGGGRPGAGHPAAGGRGGNAMPAAGGVRVASRAARQLEALLQVGAAAARVLDPEELARLALDETVRILNAERALLFLTNENSGLVRPHIGRDAAGNDLKELTGYSTTIVDRVVATREAMVLTGTEEGAALGSESAVTHGLRSILVAPLQIEDRLLGVVYLDSRLAKGIFTGDDVEILSAITSNVAFALETARLAEMELSVASERRQRQVAELLRDSMRSIGQSLEPRGVLRSILQTSVSALNSDAGAILLADGERLEVAAAVGGGVSLPPEGYDLAKADQPEIAEALRSRKPLSVSSVISERNSPLFGLLGRSGSFIVAPLVVREQAVGALVIIARRPNAFGQTQTEVAAALAGQGVVAYENAQLFARVQTLAQRDELSGVANRRYFFELAGRCFRDARQSAKPLSAMMLDIDHFKDVNDRYGHASGDDVIREVAQRISRVIGSGDIVGRYGGEEFALVVLAAVDHAHELAERLRRVISEAPVATASGPVDVTASVGVAEMALRDADLGRLLQRTDAALYEAKRAGRDQVARAS